MIIAIDVETTGLNPWTDQLLGLSIAFEDSSGKLRTNWYPYDPEIKVFPWPYDMLENPDVTKVGHNIRFDLKFLLLNGFKVNGPWEDTKLLAQLVNENQQLGLKPLAEKKFGPQALQLEKLLKAHLKELRLKMGDLGDPRVDKKLVAAYCCEDTANTLRLYKIFKADADKQKLLSYYYNEMLPLEKVLLKMELQGNRIDMDKLSEADTQLTKIISTISNELNILTYKEREIIENELWEKDLKKTKPTFNWNSSAQKIKLFYDHLGLGDYCKELTKPTKNGGGGNPSLESKVLKKLQLPDGKLKTAINLMMDLSSYTKMYGAYIEGFRDRMIDFRIHGEYYQASQEEFVTSKDSGGTVTGRLSHRNPNLGNLPRGKSDYWRGAFVKDLFIPEEGHKFIYADYSQIELRVATHLSGDISFTHAFNNNIDPHKVTAQQLGIERQQAKTVNFLLIYFGSAWRLAIELGWNPHDDIELRKAETIRQGFFAAHPELLDWIYSQRNLLKSKGFLTSMFGRVRRLPSVWSPEKSDMEHALRQGGNFVVQSVAASIAKRAMIKLDTAGFNIVNQVHDSITCMVPEKDAETKLKEMCDIMRNTVKLTIPLEVDGKILSTFKE